MSEADWMGWGKQICTSGEPSSGSIIELRSSRLRSRIAYHSSETSGECTIEDRNDRNIVDYYKVQAVMWQWRFKVSCYWNREHLGALIFVHVSSLELGQRKNVSEASIGKELNTGNRRYEVRNVRVRIRKELGERLWVFPCEMPSNCAAPVHKQMTPRSLSGRTNRGRRGTDLGWNLTNFSTCSPTSLADTEWELTDKWRLCFNYRVNYSPWY